MPHSMEAVRQGWIHILNQYKWDWFVTVTFSNQWIHPEAADKLWRFWCSKLNRKLYGPRWYKKRKEIHWVRALEFDKKGVPHFHALMSHPADLNQLMSRMEQVSDLAKFAGWSRIYPPRCQDAVAAYCSKYITKGGELDVSPFLPICEPPRLLQLHNSRSDHGKRKTSPKGSKNMNARNTAPSSKADRFITDRGFA